MKSADPRQEARETVKRWGARIKADWSPELRRLMKSCGGLRGR